MRQKTYPLSNLDCADCARKIEEDLKSRPSVRSVSVDYATLTMRIGTDDMGKVVEAVRRVEPEVTKGNQEPPESAEEEGHPDYRLRRELLILASGIVVLGAAILLRGPIRGSALP